MTIYNFISFLLLVVTGEINPFIQVTEGNDKNNSKRSKPNEENGNENSSVKAEDEAKEDVKNSGDEKQSKANTKPPEPPKDYIHVRARRGQATDSHSLAERVRISTQFSQFNI